MKSWDYWCDNVPPTCGGLIRCVCVCVCVCCVCVCVCVGRILMCNALVALYNAPVNAAAKTGLIS